VLLPVMVGETACRMRVAGGSFSGGVLLLSQGSEHRLLRLLLLLVFNTRLQEVSQGSKGNSCSAAVIITEVPARRLAEESPTAMLLVQQPTRLSTTSRKAS